MMVKMDSIPLVSVIVPIYNAGIYLKQCIDSIVGQTYSYIEVILVDDGSTDNSAEICEKYALNDSRVFAVHQQNAGQASARNAGIKIAKGDFIIFVDSDDTIAANHIEELVTNAIHYNVDIATCYAQKFWMDGKKEKVNILDNDISIYTSSQALSELCYQRRFSQGPWCKLIRKELLRDIEFPVGVGYEDMATIYKIFGKADNIVLIPSITYFYRQHSSSTMHTEFSDKKIDRVRVTLEMKKYIEEKFPENQNAVNARWLLSNLQLMMDIPFDSNYNCLKKEIYQNIKNVRKSVIRDNSAKKSLKIMAISTYLGARNLMVLGRLYKKCSE